MASSTQPAPKPREYVSKVQCPECGRCFSTRITASHIRADGLDSYKGFRAKYPDASLSVIGEVARLARTTIPKLWGWVRHSKGKIGPKNGIWDVTAISEYRDRHLRTPGGLRIPCLECSEELGPKRLFRVITWQHLRNKHALTGPEYLAKHPGSSLSAWTDLLRQVGLSTATLRKWVAEGKVPPPKDGVYDVDAILEYKNSAERHQARFPDTRRKRVGDWARGLWAERKKKLAEAERILAKAKNATEQIVQLDKVALAKATSEKLANPEMYMWMKAEEVAETFGISRATFFRNLRSYKRLQKGPKGRYRTESVIDQMRNMPKN